MKYEDLKNDVMKKNVDALRKAVLDFNNTAKTLANMGCVLKVGVTKASGYGVADVPVLLLNVYKTDEIVTPAYDDDEFK